MDDLLVRSEIRHEGVETDGINSLGGGLETNDQFVRRSFENFLQNNGRKAVLALQSFVLDLYFFRSNREKDFLSGGGNGKRGELKFVPIADPRCDMVLGAVGDLTGEEVRFSDEIGDKMGFWMVVEVVDRSELLDFSPVHQCDSVGHDQGLLLIVGDKNKRDTEFSLKVLQLQLHVLAKLGVESRKRFVEEQHFGTADEGAGQGYPLTLASGELVWFSCFQILKGNQGESLEHAAFPLGGLDPLHRQAKFDIIADVQMGKKGIALEDLIHIPPIRRKFRDIGAVDKNSTLGGSVEAGDHPQGGGFSAA